MLRSISIISALIISFNLHAENSQIVILNHDKTAQASCVNESFPICQITIGGTLVDVSAVTLANLGKLGSTPHENYEKVKTSPILWLRSSENIHLVRFETQAWLNGQRYTVSEPVLVKDGMYHVR